MDFHDSTEDAAFRDDVRGFIDLELPDTLRGGPAFRASLDAGAPRPSGPAWDRWRDAMGARSWIAPHWPTQYGGGGLSAMQQFVLNEELAQARAPRFGGIGLGWAGPTILLYGSDEQKQRHLPRILGGEERWCQGFSEPGAGSDLAGLQTRAVRDGDDYVVNGSKIWTSGAHKSDWMILLARTDANAPKHKGISYFLVDMQSPGITPRPFPDMVDNVSFNEVFFEDVRVPADNRIGEENRGWYVGATTLDFERSNIAGSTHLNLMVDDLVDAVRAHAGLAFDPLQRDPGLRFEIADRAVEAGIAKLMSYQVAWMQGAGQVPNKEASIVKLFSGELEQRIASTGMRALGPYATLWGDDAPLGGRISRMYTASVSATIGGGTSEIQRGIIAGRGLGLPRV